MHRFIEELVMGRQHPLVKLRLSALATSFAVSLVCGVRRTYTASLGAASWQLGVEPRLERYREKDS